MNIPSKIFVLYYDYKIIQKDDLNLTTECDGLCDCGNRVIYIQSGMAEERALRTLMHEVIHAYQFEVGLFNILDTQTQELVSETLSGFLCSSFELKLKE
jgi:hypothetical protein